MVIGKPLPFIRAFVEAMDEAIAAHSPGQRMSAMQRAWVSFCVTAMLVTNSICWARFERASLGTYALAALSWMLRHSKIPWDHLLVASVRVILLSLWPHLGEPRHRRYRQPTLQIGQDPRPSLQTAR